MKTLKIGIAFLLLNLILTGCSDDTETIQQTNFELSQNDLELKNSNARTLADECDSGRPCPSGKVCIQGQCKNPVILPNCGGLKFGTFSTVNTYYRYPVQSMTITAGAFITISIDPKGVPNRIVIKNFS